MQFLTVREWMVTKMKPFECDNGKVYMMPEEHCVFCRHCHDIFYDYTNGPYMFFCEENHSDFESCKSFEMDGDEE